MSKLHIMLNRVVSAISLLHGDHQPKKQFSCVEKAQSDDLFRRLEFGQALTREGFTKFLNRYLETSLASHLGILNTQAFCQALL
jgi:hypothetical protein